MKRISPPDQPNSPDSPPAGRDRSGSVAWSQADGDDAPENDWPLDRREPDDRRNPGWRSFIYGNFRPRRRNSRREADQHQFLFDWHEPQVLYLALGVLLLSCVDALFTLNLINIGASEGNAFMASMLEGGVDRFVVSKIWITSLSVVILVIAARRKFFGRVNVEHLLQFFCALYALLIGYELYLFFFIFELKIL